MISMDIKQQILHCYRVEELSLRGISRKTGADRKTVTRLVNAFEEYLRTNPEMGIDDFLAEKPRKCLKTWNENRTCLSLKRLFEWSLFKIHFGGNLRYYLHDLEQYWFFSPFQIQI